MAQLHSRRWLAAAAGPGRSAIYSAPVLSNLDEPVVRHNFRMGVLNGLLFSVVDRLMDPSLVLVAFVSHLTPSPFWIGLIIPITDGGWFLPQLWLSGYVQSLPRKIQLYRQLTVLRVAVWSSLVIAAFVVADPGWLLAAFLVTYSLTSLSAGLSGLSFLEVVGKTIPPRRRGQFFAWRLALGGVAALASTFVVRWLVDDAGPLAFPYNFALLFALGLLVGLPGLIAMARVDEPPDATVPARAALGAQVRRALRVVRTDTNYRRFLLLRIMLLVAGSAPPFFALYVQQVLGGPLAMVGVYLAVFTLVNLLAHAAFGRYSARLGNRRTMLLAAVASLLMTGLVLALALAAPRLRLSGATASLWLLPVFALYGIRESGIGVSSHSLLLDLAPPQDRTLYLGFTNTLLGVVILATGINGLIVARLGFLTLLGLALASGVLAIWSALHMHDQPVREAPDALGVHPVADSHPAP